MHRNRANALLAETRTHSKVLSKLVASADSLETSLRQKPSDSSTKNLHQLVGNEMRNLHLDGCDEQQQQTLSFLRNIPVDGNSLQLQVQTLQEPTPISHDSLYLPSGRPKGKNTQKGSSLSGQRGNVSQELSGDDSNYDNLSRSLRRKIPFGAKQCVLGRLSVHHFPIGVVSIAVTQKLTLDNTTKKHQENWSYLFDFNLYPPSWIASRAITLSLSASSALGVAPSINWSLKQAYYNSNPSLAICLQNADIPGLRRLFAEGEARPSDQLAPWGNSLLHVTFP